MFPVLERVDGIHARAGQRRAILNPQELRDAPSVALAELLGALAATQPLVLVIDDLQWGDSTAPASCWTVQPAARAARAAGGSLPQRARADSACLTALLREACRRRASAANWSSTRSSAADAERLALRLLGGDVRWPPHGRAHRARVARQPVLRPGAGRPRAGRVAADRRGLLAEGTTLDEVLRRRFSRLRPRSRRLLEVIAVAGRPLPEADAYAAAGIPNAIRRC